MSSERPTVEEAPRGMPVAATRSPSARRRRRVAAGSMAALLVGGVVAAIVLSLHRGGTSSGPDAVPPAGSPAAGSIPIPPGFPSGVSTGVPVGMSLRPYTGPLKIRKAGTVISGAAITGCVSVAANDVTIRDSRIVCAKKGATILETSTSSTGTRVERVELDGSNVAQIGMSVKNTVATGVNVHGSGDGIRLGRNSTFQDSFVHDLNTLPGVHHDDMQSTNGSMASNIRVIHNTLLAYTPTKQNNNVYHMGGGSLSDVLIESNFMDGGHYSIEVSNGDDQHDIVIRGNKFGRHYGFALLHAGHGTAVDFSANTWADSGQPATVANSTKHHEGSPTRT